MVGNIAWPPAVLPLSGTEQVPALQAGRMVGVPPNAFGGGGGGGGSTGVTPVASYAAIRAGTFPSTVSALVLQDPTKPGVFTRALSTSLVDNGGTQIKDATGQIWVREVQNRINAEWFYNAPAPNTFGDNSGLTITGADIAANPQWIGMPDGSGMYPVGTFWDYVALQEWLYACYANRSTPGNVLWNISFGSYQLNIAGYCPAGYFRINQQLMLNATGADIEFASRRGGIISWFGNKTGTDATEPGFLMNSVAYSYIRNLTFLDQKGCTTCLVSIDHQANVPGFVGGLSPQLNTFENWFVGGTGGAPTYGGIGIALAGGAAQGDTQCFINMFVGSCQNGVVIGGDNAIGALFLGGNMTDCTRGIANIGAGSFTAINLLTEGDVIDYFGYPQANQLTMDGMDFYSSEVATESSLVIGNRSESMVLGVDTNYLLEIQTSAIASAGTSAWQPNAHFQRGFLINVAGNGYTVAVLADDGGPPWFLGTLDSTGTIITVTELANGQPPNWTVNQWVGYGTWLRFGSNGFCESSYVVSNTANTLTLGQSYGTGLSYPLAYKLFSTGGPTAPNWNVSTNAYGRTAPRGGVGSLWSTLVGSDFIQGPAPPVGSWVMVCGADLFTLQNVTSSPSMPGPLFGKVAAIFNPATFQGYVVGNTMTVTSMTSGSISIGTQVINNGNVVSQLSGTPGGVGTYRLDQSTMYPTSAEFYGHITTPGTLVVTQLFSGAIAVGQTLAASSITGNPTITAVGSQASFTGQIDNRSPGVPGNTLTVTAVASGTLADNQTIIGAGIPTGINAPTILTQESGTPGGVGVYGVTGSPLLVTSEAMTSILQGVGTYTISDTTQTTTQVFMETGIAGTVTAMATAQGFTLEDNAGNPVDAGVAITNGMGYWGPAIVDAGGGAGPGLIWIPVDFDMLYGIKRTRGVQVGYGKATLVGEMELDDGPPTLLSANFLRDRTVGINPTNYRPAPDVSLAVPWQPISATPYTLTIGGQQIGTTEALYFYVTLSATLNFPVMEANLAMDTELVLEGWAATPPVITWGANVRAAAPTLTLGTQGQITVVRLKWWGTINTTGAPTSAWLVTSIQGPM